MRRDAAVLSLLLFALPLTADDFCGTSPQNDVRVRAVRERTAHGPRVASNKLLPAAQLYHGAFYVPNTERIAPGRRPFDLAGRSLVFEPRTSTSYAVRRAALQYVEPAGAPVKFFQPADGNGWHFLPYQLSAPVTLFGQQVSQLYLSAYNGITTVAPPVNGTWQFDTVEAAVFRTPVLSPLMLTGATPVRYFTWPSVYVDEYADGVRITWRNPDTFFHYDVQADLRRDGTITYSYKAVDHIEWGAPILSAGFDAWNPATQLIKSATDTKNDVSSAAGTLAPMLDIQRVETHRVANSDLFVVRITLGAAIDPAKITAGTTLKYLARVGGEYLELDVNRDGVATYQSNNASAAIGGGSGGRYSGATVELWGAQRGMTGTLDVRLFTQMTGSSKTWDALVSTIDLDTPARELASDLSSVADGTELSTPIVEPFAVPAFDPYAVWDVLAPHFGLRHDDIDAVAVYQSFLTDIIFYAGAYSTGGNPRVDGIINFDPEFFGTHAPAEAAMLHMNQLDYNYNSVEGRSSQVMLHEFGHRWLFFSRIRENGTVTHILNPISAHPAQYVHLPSAFPVYGPNESSTMGGAVFSQLGDGRWQAHVANAGYSWMDLYLMGLAAPEEVTPWFYLANTSPALGGAYWPDEGAVVSGTKREVALSQLIDVEGPRNPAAAVSAKSFRVVFALVTPPDRGPTEAEVAKLDSLRALMARNFALATGGRGAVVTEFARRERRRSAR
jgi:hypothetical protein